MSQKCLRIFTEALAETRGSRDDCGMPHTHKLTVNAQCASCGAPVTVIDTFLEYSTTRGPMASYQVTRCNSCGQQHLLQSPAQG